jgi:hypothetical protein
VLAPRLALLVKKGRRMTRLDNIATRQRKSRARDFLFAALVVLAGAVSISSVSYAAHAAHIDVAHR